LKVLLEKKRFNRGVLAKTVDSCTFSPLRFLVADGITAFGTALAKLSNLVFCSFILQLD